MNKIPHQKVSFEKEKKISSSFTQREKHNDILLAKFSFQYLFWGEMLSISTAFPFL